MCVYICIFFNGEKQKENVSWGIGTGLFLEYAGLFQGLIVEPTACLLACVHIPSEKK